MKYTYLIKPITLYVAEPMYEVYQLQAQKQGRKAAELIRNAMQEYADSHFKAKHTLKEVSFSRGVHLRNGAKDFLTDSSWKEYFDITDYGQGEE